jgi:hypothetical protein
MRREFRNQLCAYCGATVAESDDHIFAKEFFLPRDRDNLPKAPACKKCNNEKSKAEDYCLVVLPFAARHPSAHENLATLMPRRIRHRSKQRLRETCRNGMDRIWVREVPGALIQPTMTIPMNNERVNKFFQFIVKGLVWWHWRAYVLGRSSVRVMNFNEEGEMRFKDVMTQFARAGAELVCEDVKGGMFRYERLLVPRLPEEFRNPFVGLEFVPQMTLWRIWPLGGLRVASKDTVCGSFSALTDPIVFNPSGKRI